MNLVLEISFSNKPYSPRTLNLDVNQLTISMRFRFPYQRQKMPQFSYPNTISLHFSSKGRKLAQKYNLPLRTKYSKIPLLVLLASKAAFLLLDKNDRRNKNSQLDILLGLQGKAATFLHQGCPTANSVRYDNLLSMMLLSSTAIASLANRVKGDLQAPSLPT